MAYLVAFQSISEYVPCPYFPRVSQWSKVDIAMFRSVVHIESFPVVKVVLRPGDAMWNPCYRTLLKHRPSGCDQVKMWRRRLYDVIDVGTIDQSRETITSKGTGPGGYVMKRINLAKHGSNARDPDHLT
jgi:hypothetical protein